MSARPDTPADSLPDSEMNVDDSDSVDIFSHHFKRWSDVHMKLVHRSVALNIEKRQWVQSGQLTKIDFNQVVPDSSNDESNILRKMKALDVPMSPISGPQVLAVRFQKLQEWEGYVTKVANDYFCARLIDLTSGDLVAKEEAEFPLTDVSRDDRELLVIGAIFRWLIGYQRHGRGPLQRVSQIQFRRIPAWTERDFAVANEFADDIEASIEWE